MASAENERKYVRSHCVWLDGWTAGWLLLLQEEEEK
jgi:hypothetical protein